MVNRDQVALQGQKNGAKEPENRSKARVNRALYYVTTNALFGSPVFLKRQFVWKYVTLLRIFFGGPVKYAKNYYVAQFHHVVFSSSAWAERSAYIQPSAQSRVVALEIRAA